jgi:tetratricopeptide (TPR) repeat protein
MALRRLGDEAHGNKDLNTAISKYEEAYELLSKNKKDIGFNIRIAELHTERSAKGDLKAAAEYLKRAAKLDPESLKIQTDAARALEAAREYKDAVTYYRRCIDVQKDTLVCYYGIAMIEYVVDKNPSAALDTINEGLAVLDVGGPADTLKDLRKKIQSEQ